LNFISELKWNTHLVNIEDHVLVPLYFYYMERNKELETIHKRFSKRILNIKTLDVSFQFE
jgi:hypothetical protein